MASVRKIIREAFGKIVFRELEIQGVRIVSERFRHIDLAGDGLRGASFAAGDKVQIMLDEGSRTYSPFAVDTSLGKMSFLVYAHGDAPGSRWAKTVASGDRIQVFGPRGSVALSKLEGPVVLVGDETSFAVARSLLDHRGASNGLSFVFEVASASESKIALSHLEISNEHTIERKNDGGHFEEVEARVRAELGRNSMSNLVLTGQAQSIQAIRKGLKERPIEYGKQSVKAYWAPGKKGLD